MSWKSKVLLISGLGLVAACGGGGQTAASTDSVPEPSVSSDDPESSVFLDFGDVGDDAVSSDTGSPDTRAGNLFEGFSAGSSVSENGESSPPEEEASTTSVPDSVSSNAPATTVAKRKIIFTPPQKCTDTPTTGTVEEFVEALYRNCLYRPIVADSNQHWVKEINSNNGVERESVRDKSVYLSAESQCLRGVGYLDRCSDDKIFDQLEAVIGQNYEIVCEGEYDMPNERIVQRVSKVCGQ